MAGRKLPDWITGYLEYTYETEPPLSFHTWTAVSTLSGVLQRRVYMKWGYAKIYPNQFIILIGPSGKARKGDAIMVGRQFMASMSIPLMAERITREAIIRFMANNVTNFKDDQNGKIMFQSAVTCVAEELAVLLGQKDIGLLADMTDWYNSKDEWTYETKNVGTDKIIGMCFNFLGATAPDWLPSMLPHEAVGGGFTSRCIFVVEDDKRKTIANPNAIPEKTKLRSDLDDDLEQVMLMSGAMTFTDEALELYTDWYETYDKHIKEGNPPIIDPRFAGYCSRRATHIKKLCMAISASRSNDLRITKGDFLRSKALLEATEKKMPRAFQGIGKARFSEATETILHFIMKVKVISRSDLLKRFYLDIDAYMLENIERVLGQMRVIRIERDTARGDVIYRYVEDDEEDHEDDSE